MATNANTAAQWQQAKDSLASQNDALLNSYTQLDGQKSSLISKAGDLSRQINSTTDPVQKAALQAEHSSIMSDVKQVNSQIAQTNTDLQKNGDQLSTANTELNNASNGAANLNSTTPPVGRDANSSTPPVASEKPLASNLQTVKEADGTYTVVDTERGVELYNSNTPNGANTYASSVANGRSHQDAVGNANTVEANPSPQQTAQPFGSGPPDTTLLSNPQKTTEEAIARIDENRKVQADVPATVDTAGISALKAEQDRLAALNNTVKDPAVVAEEARVTAQVEAIDANRKVQADVPATVDREGIAAAAAATEKPTDQKPATTEDPMAAALAANQASNEDTPGPTEQLVLNASSEPRLSSSEQAKLEDQQAANRAALQQSDATDKAAAVLIKPGQTGTITSIPDWRVKLSLAKNGANYLYNSAKPGDILYPLKQSGGVVFPYTPQIQTAYKANYDPTDLTHSNYRMYFYKSSHIDDLTITCDFTAQDSTEASYVLAVIHFFKSVTKMFYGQDKAPSAGTPPPLLFLSGYGQYQFNKHPLLISSFNYTLPTDVDYIRASTGSNVTLTGNGGAAAPAASFIPGITGFSLPRLFNSKLNKGGKTSEPNFTLKASGDPTYVPTKIQIQISCLPVVTRNDVSKNFSLSEYANGNLTKRSSGGIW